MRVLSSRSAGRLCSGLAAAAALAVAGGARAEDAARTFEVYGFAQTDFIGDFDRVDPLWEATLRPSKIPTVEGVFGSDGQTIVSVRQSRFGVKGSEPIEGKDFNFKFEFDLFGTGVNAGETTFRLRSIYGEWGPLLAGQTNSLFMDGDLFPNVIDYWGPNGMIFLRDPQIRWTFVQKPTLSFAMALEKPANDIDAGRIRELDPALGAAITGDEKLPDLTAQLRVMREWGHVQLSAIVRRVGFDTPGTPDNEPKGHQTGWGFNLGGEYKFGSRDRLIIAGVYGHGIASYMNDGGVDLAPEGAPGDLEPKAVPQYGVEIYYDHYWDERFSTTFGYSRTAEDNTSFQQGNAFHSGDYASINLLFTPNDKFMAGGEFLWGQRVDNDGSAGDDFRFQFSIKYNFSTGNLYER